MARLLKGISKILSPNDTGMTGSHQVGIYIPKRLEILVFFPSLNQGKKNPSVGLHLKDDHGQQWTFKFIYYNNHLFGGTRNEYRLTKMTKYFRTNGLKPGDELLFWKDESEQYSISYNRAVSSTIDSEGVLRMGNQWRTINL